jgi:hypothetical protein
MKVHLGIHLSQKMHNTIVKVDKNDEKRNKNDSHTALHEIYNVQVFASIWINLMMGRMKVTFQYSMLNGKLV